MDLNFKMIYLQVHKNVQIPLDKNMTWKREVHVVTLIFDVVILLHSEEKKKIILHITICKI